MKNVYPILYLTIMLIIFLLFFLWKDMSDLAMLFLAAFGFILTSIFTYTRRK